MCLYSKNCVHYMNNKKEKETSPSANNIQICIIEQCTVEDLSKRNINLMISYFL